MSRHTLRLPITDQIRKGFKDLDFEIHGDSVYGAWGLDVDGYFLQICVNDDGEDIYLEDGLMGTNKNRILEKLEKWGLVEYMRKNHKNHFDKLCLDLPF